MWRGCSIRSRGLFFWIYLDLFKLELDFPQGLDNKEHQHVKKELNPEPEEDDILGVLQGLHRSVQGSYSRCISFMSFMGQHPRSTTTRASLPGRAPTVVSCTSHQNTPQMPPNETNINALKRTKRICINRKRIQIHTNTHRNILNAYIYIYTRAYIQ